MAVATRQFGNVVVMSPAGRIDHENASAFRDAVLPEAAACRTDERMLVLDLAAVEYMSSLGLRVLMMACKESRKQDGTVVVAALSPTMREIFQISRFTHLFRTFDTVEQALAALSSTAVAAFRTMD